MFPTVPVAPEASRLDLTCMASTCQHTVVERRHPDATYYVRNMDVLTEVSHVGQA